MGNFVDIRETLHNEESVDTWATLIDLLGNWYGREPLDVVLSYCQDHLSRWPDTIPTFAPLNWYKRAPDVIAEDPISRFFEFAHSERTDYWLLQAQQNIANTKTRVLPKFLSLGALGEMKWRNGEVLDASARTQLIAYIRTFNEIGPIELEHMRQFLDDADCQRWSKVIHGAWENAGSKSAHRWSLFQVATFGNQHDLSFTAESLTEMVTGGRHRRARQYMDISASMGTLDGLSVIGRFLVYAPFRLSTRMHAATLLNPIAKERGLDLVQFIEHRLNIHEPLSWAVEAWASPETAPSVGGEGDTFIDILEQAMLIQRAFPWWFLRSKVAALSQQSGILWKSDNSDCVVRFTSDGPVDRTGAAITFEDAELLRVLHPASISPEERKLWAEVLPSSPPFEQLERPVYDTFNQVLVPGESLPIRAEAILWQTREWQVDLSQNDCHIYHVGGAFWFASVQCNFTHDYDNGLHNNTGNPNALLELHFYSAVGVGLDSSALSEDPVIFSEAHYALARLMDVSANLTEDEIWT